MLDVNSWNSDRSSSFCTSRFATSITCGTEARLQILIATGILPVTSNGKSVKESTSIQNGGSDVRFDAMFFGGIDLYSVHLHEANTWRDATQ